MLCQHFFALFVNIMPKYEHITNKIPLNCDLRHNMTPDILNVSLTIKELIKWHTT